MSTIETGTGAGISFCYICPWYETSAFIQVPILLVAAFLLLVNKWWGYITTIALSGYVFAYGLFYLIRGIAYFGLSEMVKWILKSETNIFLKEEIQFVLAGIIFSFSIFYLARNILDIKASKSRLL